MRLAKCFFLVQFLVFLSVSSASGYYFGGLDDYAAAVPSQEQKESFPASGRETLFTGNFAGIDSQSRALIIETEVPGFFGPQKMMQPVAVSDESTVNLCNRDTGECKVLGTNGFDTIASLSPDVLKNARVHIMGYEEDVSRIISIETGEGPGG